MKILHLSTWDNRHGAARAAYRLHQGLLRLGHQSFMFVGVRFSNDTSVQVFAPPMDLLSRLRRRLRRDRISRSFARYLSLRPAGSDFFSDDRSEHGSDMLGQVPACDVINLHWVAGFVDYRTFFGAVPRHTPLIWTLHDMNPFTGGCHYDNGCSSYKNRCGSCPQLGSSNPGDLSFKIWQRKQQIFGRNGAGRLHLVAPSRWIGAAVEGSSLLGSFPVTVIPYGLDINDFAPRERLFARDSLGVPRDASVVLFVADGINIKRKGLTLLAEALISCRDFTNLFLISVGEGEPKFSLSIRHLHLGHIDNDRFLSLVYSAADVFAIPTLQENFAQTALEAMACGIPIVGFAVGGIRDIVRHGVTGLLAPPQDVSALRLAIVELLKDPSRRTEMSANCRRVALQKYTLEIQAEHYIKLYESVLAETSQKC